MSIDLQKVLPLKPRFAFFKKIALLFIGVSFFLALEQIYYYFFFDSFGYEDEEIFGIVHLISSLINLALSVLFTVLLARMSYFSYYNAIGKLSEHSFQFKPGFAAGYWFIPILLLYRPFHVLKDTESAIRERTGRPSIDWQINLLWLIYLAYLFLAQRVMYHQIFGNSRPPSGLETAYEAMSFFARIIMVGYLLAIYGMFQEQLDSMPIPESAENNEHKG